MFVRKYNRNRRRFNRPVRRFRRRVKRFRSRIPRGLGKKQFFTRIAYIEDWELNTASTVQQLRSIAFNLTMCPNYVEFTSLYDQFRINAAVVMMHPSSQLMAMANNTSGSDWSKMKCYAYTVIDYDDSVNLSDANSARQYESCRMFNPFRYHSRYLKPRFAVSTYRSPTASGYGARRGWLDCSYPEIPHYGVKVLVDGDATGPAIKWNVRVEAKFYLEFRSVR